MKTKMILTMIIALVAMTGLASAGSNNMYYNGDGSYTANFDATGGGNYRIDTYTSYGYDYQYGDFDGSVIARQDMNTWQNGETGNTEITRIALISGNHQYVETYSQDNSDNRIMTHIGLEDGRLGLFQKTTLKDKSDRNVIRANTAIIVRGDNYNTGIDAITGNNVHTNYGVIGSGVAIIGDRAVVKTYDSGKESSRQNTFTLTLGSGVVYGSTYSPNSIEYQQVGRNDDATFTDQSMYGESGIVGFNNQYDNSYIAHGYIYAVTPTPTPIPEPEPEP